MKNESVEKPDQSVIVGYEEDILATESRQEPRAIKITKAVTWIVVVASFICVFRSFSLMNFGTFVSNGFTFYLTMFTVLISFVSLAYFLLQSIMAFFYREAPDLSDKELPRCTVIVPAFNEGKYVATTLMSVLDSDYPADKLEVIAVNDGSKDDTWDWICKAAEQSRGRITTKNLIKNGGKRRALYEGIKIATGEVIVTIDSDSAITKDALRKIASPFANPKVGAVAGNIRVTNRGEGIIPKMLDVAFAFGFEFIRCAQSIIGSVLCTPGALSAYRLAAIQPLMEEWVNQTFMGRPSGIGEDRAITSMLIRENWRVVFQHNAIAFTKMPVTYRNVCKMLIRWTRSDVRENIIMLNHVLRRFEPLNFELLGLQLNLVLQSIALLLPFLFIPMALYAFFVSPISFCYYTVIGTIVWSVIPAIIYAIRYSWKESVWSYIYGLYSIPCLSWICVYSVITMQNSKWMTRPTTAEQLPAQSQIHPNIQSVASSTATVRIEI